MNCYEFESRLVSDVDFIISVAMSEPPFYSGDITFSKAYQHRREQVCPSNGWPHRYGHECFRFTIAMKNWGGAGTQYPDRWDASGVSPSLSPYTFHSYDFLNPKPWDQADPYYSRATAVWENLSRENKVGYFWFGDFNFANPENIWVAFERFEDGAQGIMYYGLIPPWEVENPVGTASLKIQKKTTPAP